METGLLWYDGDPQRPFEDKVTLAATRYREKYGCWPDTCYVHSNALGRSDDEMCVTCGRCQVRVLTAPNILLHHFWLGVGESAPTQGTERRAAYRGNTE